MSKEIVKLGLFVSALVMTCVSGMAVDFTPKWENGEATVCIRLVLNDKADNPERKITTHFKEFAQLWPHLLDKHYLRDDFEDTVIMDREGEHDFILGKVPKSDPSFFEGDYTLFTLIDDKTKTEFPIVISFHNRNKSGMSVNVRAESQLGRDNMHWRQVKNDSGICEITGTTDLVPFEVRVSYYNQEDEKKSLTTSIRIYITSKNVN